MRIDQQVAESLIRPGTRVLDLGCGDGELLAHLKATHGVSGYGVEIDPDKITQAIGRGIDIIEHDLNQGLSGFPDHSFDYAIMAQAIQAVDDPRAMLIDLLRVAETAVVTFPNFAHIKNRIDLGVFGQMPMSKSLPHAWFNTPNIHLCTIKDFERLCAELGIRVIQRIVTTSTEKDPWWVKLAPNLTAALVIYQLKLK